MSSGGTLWRGLLVAILAIAVAGCTRTLSTTNYKVTIRVDGRDYTSDVVAQSIFDVVGDRSRPHPYGRVMTFRLPDDRVVVLGTDMWRKRLECTPRLDQTDTGCPKRWVNSRMHLWPDGYVFNSATNPTSVEAFQFEPRDRDFAPRGFIELENGVLRYRVPISEQRIEMVSYSAKASTGPARDTISADFPGYDQIHKQVGVSDIATVLSSAANAVGLPAAKYR
jgi:hypothetical protein